MLRKTMLVLAFASAAIALVLIAVVGGKLSSAARVEAHPSVAVATPEAAAPIVGELVGTTAEGRPVYRLPPITVATTRSEVLARIEREDRESVAGAVRLPDLAASAPQRDVRAEASSPVVR